MKLRINPFEWLYIAISIATFTHTSWGASMSFEGNFPTDEGERFQWYLAGILIAIAIDVGMFLSARYVAKTRSIMMGVAFLVAAVSSFYMQVLYIYHHSPIISSGAGVSTYWVDTLKGLIEARVIILPLLLPVLAVVYTISRMDADDHKAVERVQIDVEQAAQRLQVDREDVKLLGDGHIDWDNLKFFDVATDRWYGPYKSEATMRAALKSRATRRRNTGITIEREEG